MDVSELLLDMYGRVPPLARDAVEGLTAEQLVIQPEPGANTIGWLIWHLARGTDSQIAEIMDGDQIWVSGDYAEGFGLEPDPDNHGYGHTADQMASVRPDGPAVLLDYLDAVDVRAREYLAGLQPDDLDRVVDDSWDPPVTLGVRLISIVDDCVQHVGQANYVRGLITGSNS